MWDDMKHFNRLEELIKNTSFIEITLKSIGNGIIATDLQGNILFMNYKAEQITGWTRNEAQGKAIQIIFQITSPTGLETIESLVKQVINTGKEMNFSKLLTLIKKNNQKVTITNFIAPIRNSLNKIVGSVIIFRDITKEEQLQKQISENDLLFRKIFDSIQEGISVLDPDLNILQVNDFMKKRYSNHLPIIGKKCYHVYQNSHEICQGCPSIKALATKQRQENIVSYISPHGEQGWLQLTSFPIFDEQGKIIGIIEVLKDISEIIQVQEELQEGKLRLENIIEATEAGTWEWHIPTKKIRINHFWAEMLGYTKEELQPVTLETWEKLSHPDDLKDAYQNIQAHFDHKSEYYEFQQRMKHKNGHWVWILDRGKVLEWDENNLPVWMLGTHFNITREKQIEAQEKKIQKHNQQMRKIEAIGQLAGGVAHDLNNLLTPIIGYGEMLLQDQNLTKDQQISIEEILKASTSAKNLVSQLLTFSRKQPIFLKPTDINVIIQNFQNLLRRTIRENIAIHIDLGNFHFHILADKVQVEQVIMNLVINAQDAMKAGGNLTIRTEVTLVDETYQKAVLDLKIGLYVVLSVSDTGIGMNEETRNKIFDPFFTTKQQSTGTGLGLPTVYGIMKQHQGGIDVYSEVGKGSTFRCYFPIIETNEEEIEHSLVEIKDLSGNETILVVEDNKMVRKLIRQILQQQGYSVLSAADGESGLLQLKTYQGQVDLLLTDVVMPKMDGHVVAKIIKELIPEISVLYMSGYAEDALTHNEIRKKEIDLIQKPFTLNEFLQKIRKILDSRHKT